MAGKRGKPIELIKLEGKSHKTKKEIEFREKAEKSLYTGVEFKASPEVERDPVAYAEFLRLKDLYSKIKFVDALDEQIINRYCLLISKEKMLSQVEELHKNELYKLRELLLKLEDRLLLNPVSRMRAIPKTPPEDEKKSPMAEFLSRIKAGGENAAQ